MASRKEYYKKWRSENPEKVKALDKIKNSVHRKRYATDPEFRQHWKRTVALQRYKMTPAEFDTKLEEQDGHCALCEATEGDAKKSMHVDHNHECCKGHKTCGKCVRGILCGNCNRRLATVEDLMKEGNITPQEDTWLEKAMAYLEAYARLHNPPYMNMPPWEWQDHKTWGIANYPGQLCVPLRDQPLAGYTGPIFFSNHPRLTNIRIPGSIPETQE